MTKQLMRIPIKNLMKQLEDYDEEVRIREIEEEKMNNFTEDYHGHGDEMAPTFNNERSLPPQQPQQSYNNEGHASCPVPIPPSTPPRHYQYNRINGSISNNDNLPNREHTMIEQVKKETELNNAIAANRKSRERIKKTQREEEVKYQIRTYKYDLYQNPPIPLPDESEFETPPFPTFVFTTEYQELTEHISDFYGVHVEAVGPALISTTAAAAKGNVDIQVKRGYKEPLILSTIIASGPGANKTGLTNFVIKPIDDIVAERQNIFNKGASIRQGKKIGLDEVKKLLKKELRDELADSSEEAYMRIVEKHAKKIANWEKEDSAENFSVNYNIRKATSKGIAVQLSQQNGRGMIFDSEPSIFDDRFNHNDLELLLKAANGETYSDTTGRNKIYMSDPCLNIFLFIQPGVLERVFGIKNLDEVGFLARFSVVLVPRKKNINLDVEEIPSNLVKHHTDKVCSLFEVEPPPEDNSGRTAYVIHLNDGAVDLWKRYRADIMKQILHEEFENCESYAYKLAGKAVRYAGVLHLMKHDEPYDKEIDASTMKDGITLADFYAAHTKIAYDEVQLQALKYAKKILNKIREFQHPVVKKRDLYRPLGAKEHFVQGGLDLLVRHNFVRLVRDGKSVQCVISRHYINTSSGPYNLPNFTCR